MYQALCSVRRYNNEQENSVCLHCSSGGRGHGGQTLKMEKTSDYGLEVRDVLKHRSPVLWGDGVTEQWALRKCRVDGRSQVSHCLSGNL